MPTTFDKNSFPDHIVVNDDGTVHFVVNRNTMHPLRPAQIKLAEALAHISRLRFVVNFNNQPRTYDEFSRGDIKSASLMFSPNTVLQYKTKIRKFLLWINNNPSIPDAERAQKEVDRMINLLPEADQLEFRNNQQALEQSSAMLDSIIAKINSGDPEALAKIKEIENEKKGEQHVDTASGEGSTTEVG